MDPNNAWGEPRAQERLHEEIKERKNPCHGSLQRVKFFSYKIAKEESVDVHFNSLSQLASGCEFGDQSESMIRDKILGEYNDSDILEKLQEEDNFTLERVLELLRAKEKNEISIPTDSSPRLNDTSVKQLTNLENAEDTCDYFTQPKIISKERIDTVLFCSLNDRLSLNTAKALLETVLNYNLSQDDKNYIQSTYLEQLTELWLDEASENVMDMFDNNDPFEFIDELNSIKSLQGCLVLGLNTPYNNLLKDLCKDAVFTTFQEEKYILKFKSTILSFMLLKSAYLRGEINFLQSLTRAMKISTNVQQFCSLLNASSFVESSEDETLSFKKFLQDIGDCSVVDNSIRQLKTTARVILEQERFFFVKCVRETIKAYLKPFDLTESFIDGRLVLEVSGEHLVVSEVLPKIRKSSKFCDFEEVRFVNAGVIHINANLNPSLWHGKNIVIYAETVIISKDKNIIWDVSGKDAEDENSDQAIMRIMTGSDGVGLKGADGKPGESGGNILLLCDEIENSHNLMIVSNGGKGSKGQEGGNGRNGKNGECISKFEFEEKFPPVSKFWDSDKQVRLQKTRFSVIESIQSAELSVLGSLIPISKDKFNAIFEDCILNLKDIYFEVKTQSGCKIMFSFYYGPLFTFCQSFLLHKGSDGEPGKDGGIGGLGGKGGYAGDVEIQVSRNHELTEEGITKCTNKGEDGKHGESGVSGKPGKSGLDCAYIDSTTMNTAKTFIPHQHDHHRLSVKYHTEKGPDRVFCFHNGQYAEIAKVTKEFSQSYISKTKRVDNSQFDVQVTRKKTINPMTILKQYDHKTSKVDLQKCNDFENKIKHIYELVSEEDLQQQTVHESNIIRKVEFFHNDLFEGYLNPITLTDSHQVASRSLSSEEQPTKFVNDSLTNVGAWKSLTQIQLSLEELRSLWNINNIQSLSLSGNELDKEVNLLWRNKYHLAVLEYLQQLCIEEQKYVNSSNTNSKSAGLIQSGLVLTNDQVSCNAVESYLCEDTNEKRLDIITQLGKSDRNFWIEVFNLFLDEGHSFLSENELKQYKKDLDDLKQTKSKNMNNNMLPILNDLKNPRSHDLYNRIVEAINSQNINLMVDVEHEMRTDVLLRKLYEKYQMEVQGPLVWKSRALSLEYLSKEFEKGIIDDIKHKGASSVFYREILARHFNTNILLYTVNDYNQRVLVYNHNPAAKEEVHILLRNKQFLKLKLDEELCKMIRLHREKGQVYNQIQLHLDSLTDKDQFDQLLSDSPFLTDGFNAVSKSVEIGLKIKHMLMEDDNIQFISNSFEVDDDKYLISSRLRMLKHEFTGYQSVLYYIALHMKCEGNHLSVAELCYVINFTLKSLLESPPTTCLVSWIIASYHQIHWVTEFTLLKLELYFKQSLEQKLKCKWRKYLNETNKDTLLLFLEKLDNDQSLASLESVNEVLFLVSQIPYHYAGLCQLDLAEWKYLLKGIFWNCKVKSIGSWSEEQLRLSSFHLLTLENTAGTNLCLHFVEVIKNHLNHEETEDRKIIVLNTLRLLTSKETLFNENLLESLSDADLNDWAKVIDAKYFLSFTEVRTPKQLSQLIKNNSNTSNGVLTIIDDAVNCVEKISLLLKFLNSRINDELRLKMWITSLLKVFNGNIIPLFSKEKPLETKFIVEDEQFQKLLEEMKKEIVSMGTNDNCTLEEKSQSASDFLISNLNEIFIATVCASIYVMFEKIHLRDTQLLAIMTFMKTSGNVLGQVATGEGKSFIIISAAIMKALSGSKVDIITSSHVLARRDATAFEHICNIFGTKVGHNCSDNIEERKTTYSSCQIVYGELAYYQRDYLLDRVYNNNVLGDRTYETVILDEVDSMLLDKGNNVLYLSHEIPGLDKLEPLFVFIWKSLNLPYSPNIPKEWFSVAQLRDAVLYEMYGQIKEEDIRNLDTSLEEEHVRQTWQHLQTEGVIDSTGKVLHVDQSKLDKVAGTCIHGDHVKYLFNKIITRKKTFEIPNYLKQFVEDHLEEWIKSAINAMNLKVNVDYVVDVDRSVDSADRNPNIIIVDRDTGTDLTNSQWDQGIHQFLQLKHGCRLSPLSFKAVFISNVTYLKLYSTLIGLTGTLGSKNDRDLLEEVYQVEFVTMPTAKAKDFTEKLPILCGSADEWSSKIFEEVYDITTTRSALIICESVSDVLFLKKDFDTFIKSKLSERPIHTYTRDYEELTLGTSLDPGHIIISTNLAGRGTDIKLSDKLIDAGGLHICLSFLPSNCRIEEQAFGRAARNGEPGSGQLIFRNYGQNSASKVVDLKKERDISEVFRISDVKKYYETKITQEEKWFNEFQKTYSDLRKSKHCNEIKAILLMTCLDQWAIWLEKNTNPAVTFSLDGLISSVSKLSDDRFNIWSDQIQDPYQLTKLGLLYLKLEENDKSRQLFDRVIASEPVFSEAAHYYRVCARSAEEDMERTDLINELAIVEKKLKDRVESSFMSAEFIDCLKTYNKRSFLQINSFKKQQQTNCQTHGVFIESIQNIIGHYITPESFLYIGSNPQHGTSEEKFSSIIFNDLIRHNIIQQKIKDNVTENDLNFVLEYGMCPQKALQILKSCNFKKITGLKLEGDILKSFRKSGELPSREMFWNQLVSAGILRNEEKYAFINHQSLKEVDPSLAEHIKKYTIDINTQRKDRVSLYSREELGQLEECFTQCYSLYFEEVLENGIGSMKLEFLKQENLIRLNRQATVFNVADTVEFDNFDCITQKDFAKVGIPAKTTDYIIEDLINQQIIFAKEKGDQLKYSLSINFEDIYRFELERHRVYSDDVRNLLLHCFAFRIGLQKFEQVLLHCKGDYSNLCLPLHTNIEKRLWQELQHFGVIERVFSNMENDKISQLKSVYSDVMGKDGYIQVFCKVYDEATSKKIVHELIKRKWLKETILHNISPNYSINFDQSVKGGFKLAKPEELSSELKNHVETIELILLNHLHLSHNVKSIERRLCYLAGGIHGVETPILSLKSLEIVMKECGIATSEVNTFSLNGFDQVVYLEEKKYTKRMKSNTFWIGILAVTEIAVGVFLEFWLLGNPLGFYFISQGIDDLLFVTNCIFTGHFSWKSYMFNKLASVITASLTCVKAFSSIRRSEFASKTADISLQTLKDKCCNLFSKIKSSVSGLFQSEVTRTVNKGEIIIAMSKRVVVHAAEGVACGATFALINHIENKVADLGEIMTDLINSDVKNTVMAHPIFQSAVELCNKLGKKRSKKILEDSLLKVNNEYQVKLESSFDLIDLSMIETLIKRTISKGIIKKSDNTPLLQITTTATSVCNVIKSAWSHIQLISTLVSDILNEIHKDIQSALDKLREVEESSTIPHSELDDFKCDVLSSLQSCIKSIMSQHISNKILSPILDCANSCFLKYSFRIIGKISKSLLTDEEIYKLSQRKRPNFQMISKEETGRMETDFFYSDFNKISCELLKTRKNKSAMANLVSQNAPIDLYCLDLCFKMIPLALSQEGYRIPSLRVELELNGTKHVFDIGDTRGQAPLSISPDADLSSNLVNNRLFIKNVFQFLCESFLQGNPEYKGLTASVLQEVVLKFFDNFCNSHCSGSSADEEDPSPCQYGQLNTVVEKETPYQHTHYGGGWKFNPQVDADLRETDKLINLNHVDSQILKGFETALEKINNHIHMIQDSLRYFNLVLDDFSTTKHQLAPPPPFSTSQLFRCYTVQYELVVPVMLKGFNTLVDFNIVLCLENESPKNKLQPHSPNGPHILYEINPLGRPNAKFLNKGLKGHILLNIDCSNTSYSVKDCHVAGELIIASVPPKQKQKNIKSKTSVIKVLMPKSARTKASI